MGELPPIGLGTMGIEDHETIATAIELGYTHLDTAQLYENEAVVGEGIAAADVPRDDLFVATKIWVDRLSHDEVLAAAEESRDRLGVDEIDLLYVHRPRGDYDPEGTLSAFDELVDRGAIRHVGVSNFEPAQLDEARDVLDAPIFAHQTELHPLYQRHDLIEYAREHDHWAVAYAPVMAGRVTDVTELAEIAEKHDATPAQVSLAWLASKETVASIPKASSLDHLESNFAATDVALDDEDVARIEGIDREDELYPE